MKLLATKTSRCLFVLRINGPVVYQLPKSFQLQLPTSSFLFIFHSTEVVPVVITVIVAVFIVVCVDNLCCNESNIVTKASVGEYSFNGENNHKSSPTPMTHKNAQKQTALQGLPRTLKHQT